MKQKIQFVYPAIFIKNEDDTVQVIFPDLEIYTDGQNISEAYLNAKDLLWVYFSYAVKYETDFNKPSKVENLMPKCKESETIMLVEAIVEVNR